MLPHEDDELLCFSTRSIRGFCFLSVIFRLSTKVPRMFVVFVFVSRCDVDDGDSGNV